ncbi:type II toxin-antitoxin system ParD family antitoxin [Haloplanus salinarum]|jgi:Arc/MetJ-type ribon-helix-helix transcriptional regulator
MRARSGGHGVSKISVEIPDELLADLDEHVGEDGKFVNRSDAIRASIRKNLDLLDEIDARHGRLEADE